MRRTPSPSLLLLFGPSEKRRRANGKAACTARGRREGSRRFGCRPWMACQPNPFARSEPLASRAARIRGCRFLWLLSFGQAKESNRRPWMADETHTDVSRLSRQRRRTNRRKGSRTGFRPSPNDENWIPAFAGMTKNWIPAFAGMTENWIPAFAGMTNTSRKTKSRQIAIPVRLGPEPINQEIDQPPRLGRQRARVRIHRVYGDRRQRPIGQDAPEPSAA